jgi:primosomal protein N'
MFLFIHPRKGLFSITKCNDCGFVFGCNNCTNELEKPKSLTLFSKSQFKFFMGCNQCQTSYVFDQKCPSCKNSNFQSKFGGIDELKNILEDNFKLDVTVLESAVKKPKTTKPNKTLENISPTDSKKQAILTTRLFDPTMDYSQFHTIIVVQSQNLLAGTDYLMQEELYKNLCELFLANISEDGEKRTKIIFDTIDTELEFFGSIRDLAESLGGNSGLELDVDGMIFENSLQEPLAPKNPLESNENPALKILQWHQKISQKESHNRKVFGFPPFYNLLLLTTQEKKKDQALSKIRIAKNLIQSQLSDLGIVEVRIGSPYSARFLQRKGMYSYHLLLKFPRQYRDFEQLKTVVSNTAFSNRIQVRLNPQHLF